MIHNSAIITAESSKSGRGVFAVRSFKLGILEHLRFYQYFPENNDFPAYQVVKNFSSPSINILLSYSTGSVFKKDVEKYALVNLADPFLFHLSKYTENAVGTIYDFFLLDERGGFMSSLRRAWFIKNLNYISHLKVIITPSDLVKNQAEKAFPNAHFETVYPWATDDFKMRDKRKAREKLCLPEDKTLLLSVGSNAPQKNVELLPQLMNQLDTDFLLLRIGPVDKIIDGLKRREQLVGFDSVSDDLYPLFFNASDVLLQPSMKEGFGIPIVEAMRSGLPVVASSVDIFQEILGDKGVFADPNDPASWKSVILNCLANLEDSRANVIDRSRKFTEDEARLNYSRIYNDVIGG